MSDHYVDPNIELTPQIIHNLSLKAALYLDRTEAEKEKVLIFTDDTDLWVEDENTSIHTDKPLPPIPEGYVRQQYECLFDKMLKAIRGYLRLRTPIPNVYWALYNSGSLTTPRMHVIFSHYNLKDHRSTFVKHINPNESGSATESDIDSLSTCSSDDSECHRPRPRKKTHTFWGHLSTIISEEDDTMDVDGPPPSGSGAKPPLVVVTHGSVDSTSDSSTETSSAVDKN